MKKFLKKRPWGTSSNETNTKTVTENLSLVPRKELGDQDLLREKIFLLEHEGQKLRDVTQKLLNENVDLKEKLSIVLSESIDGPTREEMSSLVDVVTAENDLLIKSLNDEQSNSLEVKAVHLKEVDDLTRQLDVTHMENIDLNSKLNEVRMDCNRLKMQLKLLMTEGGPGTVPIKVHQNVLHQSQHNVTNLKQSHNEQITRLKTHCQVTDAQVRTLTLRVAELEAQLHAQSNLHYHSSFHK